MENYQRRLKKMDDLQVIHEATIGLADKEMNKLAEAEYIRRGLDKLSAQEIDEMINNY